MSEKTPVYSKRMDNMREILNLLAINKEVYQNKIAKYQNIKFKYRTVLRQLHYLEKLGFVRFVRFEKRNKTPGKPRNVWEITFDGIIENLIERPENIDKIAKAHKEKWFVLQEWGSISSDPEIKEIILNRIHRRGLENTPYSTTHKNKETVDFFLNQQKEYPELYQALEEHRKIKITLDFLLLDIVFTQKAYPPYIETKPDHLMVRHLKNCWTNPRIRQFMKKMFELEKKKHQGLLLFEKYFEGLVD